MTDNHTAPLSAEKPDFSAESEAAHLASIWKLSTPQYQRLVEAFTRAMARSRPAAKVTASKDEALEEAAKVADAQSHWSLSAPQLSSGQMSQNIARNSLAKRIAAAIRALKSPEPQHE